MCPDQVPDVSDGKCWLNNKQWTPLNDPNTDVTSHGGSPIATVGKLHVDWSTTVGDEEAAFGICQMTIPTIALLREITQ